MYDSPKYLGNNGVLQGTDPLSLHHTAGPSALSVTKPPMQELEDWHKINGPDIPEAELEAAITKVKGIGSSAFKAGKVTEAATWFSKGLKLKQDPALYSNRSACYCWMKDYKKALQDADRCIYLSPGWGKVRAETKPLARCAIHRSCSPHRAMPGVVQRSMDCTNTAMRYRLSKRE